MCTEYKYTLAENKITLTDFTDEVKAKKIENELIALRTRREKECFAIINRGQLWYDTLTDEQKAELNLWYYNWLQVTDTKLIPIKPEWIV